MPNSSQATGPKVGEKDYDTDFYRSDGNSDSPFTYKAGRGNGYPTQDDHLVAMLERRNVASTNVDGYGPTGAGTTNPMTYSPTPGGNGQGTLDSVASPNNAQNGNGLFGDSLGQGKTVGGEDLHVSMLDKQYTSNINPLANYGAGQPGSTYPVLDPSPVPRDQNNFQDINGLKGPQFANFRNTAYNIGEEVMSPNQFDTVSELGLTGTYKSTVNPTTVYNSNWPTPSRTTTAYGPLDIDGTTPSKYQDSIPQ